MVRRYRRGSAPARQLGDHEQGGVEAVQARIWSPICWRSRLHRCFRCPQRTHSATKSRGAKAGHLTGRPCPKLTGSRYVEELKARE